MQPIIDHIHITVEDLARAEELYDRLLPLLGFDLSLKEHDCVPEHEYRIVEYHHGNLSIGLINQRAAYKSEKKPEKSRGTAPPCFSCRQSVRSGRFVCTDKRTTCTNHPVSAILSRILF